MLVWEVGWAGETFCHRRGGNDGFGVDVGRSCVEVARGVREDAASAEG